MSRLTPRKQRNECKENLSSWLNHIYFLQLQLPKMCPDLQLVGGCRVTGVTSAARRKRKTQKLRKRITESIGQEIPNSRDIPNRSTATRRRVELKINQPRAACPQTLKASSVFVFPRGCDRKCSILRHCSLLPACQVNVPSLSYPGKGRGHG